VIPLKIIRFAVNDTVRYGVLDEDAVHSLLGRPWDGLDLAGPQFPLADCRLLAPVAPPDVWAIGFNYRAHAEELQADLPSAPLVFLKATSSLLGPGEEIRLPAMAPEEVDYEAELVIVIGRPCHRVAEAEALDYVLGYTCGNDVSARDCQLRLDKQFARGKSFDTFCPLGPWIETDLDPEGLAVSSTLNGRIMQEGNTRDLLFSCRRLVSYLSEIATLRPGTVIMTGTPAGVGYKRTPPVFLREGDTIEVTVEGIGRLRNTVGRETSP
jgi:2-keto-4-pentenoate hydratase/2-oxohepta-3-ene-1,7-dioic acid hydratase in catechol pathway